MKSLCKKIYSSQRLRNHSSKEVKTFLGGVLIGFLTVGCGSNPSRLFEAWDGQNDPIHFDSQYQKTFKSLPQSGNASRRPWSDDYWPSYRGGIAARWRVGEDGFKYKSPSKAELRKMTLKERSELSPAEKFDAFRGDYLYPTVQSERKRTFPDQPTWEGLCHGWATASMQHDEPYPVIVRNQHKIDIPFASSDLKALLTYFHGQESYVSTDFLGMRCNVTGNGGEDPRVNNPECRDLNAGSFHVVIANELGIKKMPFVGDVVRDLEVWNQPIYSFSTELVQEGLPPSSGAAPKTVEEVVVKTRMNYIQELSPQWGAQKDESIETLGTKQYEYRLELNAEGAIIGGEWLGYERPDFFWRQSQAEFMGRWRSLKELLDKSASQPRVPEDPRDEV